MNKLATTKGNAWLIVLLIVAIIVVALLLTRQSDDVDATVDTEATEEVMEEGTEAMEDAGAAALEAMEDETSEDAMEEEAVTE